MSNHIRIWWMMTGSRWVEKAQIAVAWAIPEWLAYWCAIRVITHATTGTYSNQVVPDLAAMDALKRWEQDHRRPRRDQGRCV